MGYSRRAEIEGYYLQHPPLQEPRLSPHDEINQQYVESLRRMSVPEKLKLAFSSIDFALRQRELTLSEKHPDWSLEAVEQEARRQVFRADEKNSFGSHLRSGKILECALHN